MMPSISLTLILVVLIFHTNTAGGQDICGTCQDNKECYFVKSCSSPTCQKNPACVETSLIFSSGSSCPANQRPLLLQSNLMTVQVTCTATDDCGDAAFTCVSGLCCAPVSQTSQAVAVDQSQCPPTCRIGCEYGMKTDERGCYICECRPNPCTTVKCAEGQKCVVKGTTMSNIHAICENACSDVWCKMMCPMGRKLDSNGCPICECIEPCTENDCSADEICKTCTEPPCLKPYTCTPRDVGGKQVGTGGSQVECPPTCRIGCKYGMETDLNGCYLCTCRPDPCTSVSCPTGQKCVVIGAESCAGPACKPSAQCVDICSGVTCHILCPMGRKLDSQGCPLCECNYDVCDNNTCSANQMCKVCTKPPCPKPYICIPRGTNCPPTCRMGCKYGMQTDANGCYLCACRPDPCTSVTCPTGQKCVVKGADTCPGTGCEPRAVCENICSGVTCRLLCPMGRKLDSQGCPLCECERDMCDNKCLAPKVCYMVKECVQCEKKPACVATDDIYLMRSCLANLRPMLYMVSRFVTPIPCNTNNDCRDASATCTNNACCTSVVAKNTGVSANCPPVCYMECPFGMEFDERGCAICKCRPHPCTIVRCPTDTKCVVYGTDTCSGTVCPDLSVKCEKSCPAVLCENLCLYGRKNDSQGCPTCECLQDPCQGNCTAPNECYYGKTCNTCAKKPVCADSSKIVLLKQCPGNMRPLLYMGVLNVPMPCKTSGDCWDANVTCVNEICCATDANKPTQGICPPTCRMGCKYGMQTDANGCYLCACRPDPCASVTCPTGQKCVVKGADSCSGTDCNPSPVCEMTCPAVLCSNSCPMGWKMDSQGCQTCKCNDVCNGNCPASEDCYIGTKCVGCAIQTACVNTRQILSNWQKCPGTKRPMLWFASIFVTPSNCKSNAHCSGGECSNGICCASVTGNATTLTKRSAETPAV